MTAAATAWACTENAYLEAAPARAPAGTQIIVSGRDFHAGPVTIHWGSAEAEPLATPAGPQFEVTVTVPRVTPRTYYLYAKSGSTTKVNTFTVTGPKASQPDGEIAPPETPPTDPDPAATQQAPSLAPADTVDPGATSSDSGATTTPRESTPSAGRPASQVLPAPATAPPAPDRPPTGAPVVASPVPAGDENHQAAAPEPAAPARSIADLWSGFDTGRSFTGERILDPEKARSPQGNGLVAGAVLLATGLAAMAASMGMVLRRRPRTARTPPS